MLRHLKRSGWIIGLLLLSASLVTAQDTCEAVVQDIITQVSEACSELDRNQACYGSAQVDITLRDDAEIPDDLRFEAPGDTVNVNVIDTMLLTPFSDEDDTSEWGMALLRLQANLPETLPGQAVTLALFGESRLVSEGADLNAFTFSSGIGEVRCADAPNGMLIQTPLTADAVQLTINGVQVTLGSTLYVTKTADEALAFALVDGTAMLTVEGETVELAAGEFSTVPLDDALMATGAPSEPAPFTSGAASDEAMSPTPLPAEDPTATPIVGGGGRDFDLAPLPYEVLPYDPTMPPEPDADDEDDPANDSDTASEEIIPRSGIYNFIFGPIEFGESCPAETAEMSADLAAEGIFGYGDNTQGNNAEFDFSDGNVLEAIFGEVPPMMTTDNPETNVYTVTLEPTVWTYRIVSETRIEGSMEQPHSLYPDCLTIAPIVHEYQGEAE